MMSKSFLVVGLLLSLLGVGAYVASGAASITALIPAFVGVPIAGCAWSAGRSARPWRWNIVAAVLTLVGLTGSLRGFLQLPNLVVGADVARPMAVVVLSTMALLCVVFLMLFLVGLVSRGLRPGEIRRCS